MKISTQLTAGAAGIVILCISGVATMFVESSSNDIKVLNYTGIVRGETQRLVKLELSDKPNDELIAKLDKIVGGLINGSAELGLENTTEHEDYQAKMQEVQTAWNQLKTDIQQFRTTKNDRASLLSHSEAYFELANEAAKLTEDELLEHTTRLKQIELGIFAINLVIIAIVVAASRRITSTLKTFTEDIANSSDNIASTVERQEANISEQASSVSQTTDTVDQLGMSSRQSAAQAEASTISANQALNLAREGAQTVEQTMTGMENLKETVRAIAEQITNLSEQTGQIASVSELVGDLANQTNMLALNAAVEAAHAGEHGKGFGVVAREIRKLADESRKSADRIHNLVTEVQTAMNGAVIVTERGKKTAESSIALAQGTAQSLVGVKDAVNSVFANTQQISETAKLQAISIQEILSAINALNFTAMDTAEGMNEVKTSSVKLKEFADQLKAIV
jgi:methyl-accepting chemotaxis protein